MNRQDFLRTSGLASLGLFLPKFMFSAELSPTNSLNSLNGFMLPTLLSGDGGKLDTLFKGFLPGGLGSSKTAAELFDKGISHVLSSSNPNQKIASAYKTHYELIISKLKGTKDLNGMGYTAENLHMAALMSNHKVLADTPIHHVRDLGSFNPTDWSNYCDVADLQIVTTPEGKQRAYVSPKDNRAEEYRKQPTFWVESELLHLLYNPVYYCYGLPIQNPQLITIDENTLMKIVKKTGKKASEIKTDYYQQQFYYHGGDKGGCKELKELQNKVHTIWWGHDDAVGDFYELKPLEGCGDPTNNCNNGIPSTSPKAPIEPRKVEPKRIE